MSRRATAADDTLVMPETRHVVRVTRPTPTPWIDSKALLIAALIASPALYRAQQGLLSGTAVIERFGMIAAGSLALSIVVRTLWPILIGSDSPKPPAAAPAVAAPAATTTNQGLNGFEDLDLNGMGDFDPAPFPAAGEPTLG